MPYGLKINEYSHQQLRAIVAWIQSDTLLRTEDQLLTEMMRELGFQKRGKRIAEAIISAIKAQRATTEGSGLTATARERSRLDGQASL